MKNVKRVPDLAPYNLFSITWALNNGFQLGNKGKIVTLKNGDFTVTLSSSEAEFMSLPETAKEVSFIY